jgi:chorismate lyase
VNSVAPTSSSIPAWIDAAVLVSGPVHPVIREWLTYPGLLSARMRELFGARYELRVVRERTLQHERESAARMSCVDGPLLVREIEILNSPTRVMFAQTCIPQSTLADQPWLAQLGTRSLGETLAQVSGVRRGELEFKALDAGDAVFAAVTRTQAHSPLWARRSVFAIAGAPLLVTEVFMPELEGFSPC